MYFLFFGCSPSHSCAFFVWVFFLALAFLVFLSHILSVISSHSFLCLHSPEPTKASLPLFSLFIFFCVPFLSFYSFTTLPFHCSLPSFLFSFPFYLSHASLSHELPLCFSPTMSCIISYWGRSRWLQFTLLNPGNMWQGFKLMLFVWKLWFCSLTHFLSLCDLTLFSAPSCPFSFA